MVNLRLTWIVTQRTRLESTPSHPRHPGDHDLLLEPPGFSLFVLIDLTLESLNLTSPFSEADRVRLGYIVCPSTSSHIHEEERRVVRAADVRFPTCPERSNWSKQAQIDTRHHSPQTPSRRRASH
jgi:hypothetical protein